MGLALASPNARGRTTKTHAWRRQFMNRPTGTIRQTSSVVSGILIPFRAWGLLRSMRFFTGRGDMEWNCSHSMLYLPHTALVQASYQQPFKGQNRGPTGTSHAQTDALLSWAGGSMATFQHKSRKLINYTWHNLLPP